MLQKSSFNINYLLWKDYFKRGDLILAVAVRENIYKVRYNYTFTWFLLSAHSLPSLSMFFTAVLKYSPRVLENQSF